MIAWLLIYNIRFWVFLGGFGWSARLWSTLCVSILKNGEGCTSAYAFKAVSIQLLSLFSSVRIEQDYGGIIKLDLYRKDMAKLDLAMAKLGIRIPEAEQYVCSTCRFGTPHALGNNNASLNETLI